MCSSIVNMQAEHVVFVQVITNTAMTAGVSSGLPLAGTVLSDSVCVSSGGLTATGIPTGMVIDPTLIQQQV